jgi:plastocyanin
VPLINDPENRIYRGPDPSLLGTLDRVETVTFAQPGRYFVTCGLLPHFNDGMYGFVKVI